MTTKEMLNAVIKGEITDEVKAKATEMLAAEKKNTKRAEATAENRSANAALAAEIVAVMADGTEYSAAELLPLGINAVHIEITKNKTASVMAVAKEDGLVEINPEYKEGGKGRKKNGYKKLTAATEEVETE